MCFLFLLDLSLHTGAEIFFGILVSHLNTGLFEGTVEDESINPAVLSHHHLPQSLSEWRRFGPAAAGQQV